MDFISWAVFAKSFYFVISCPMFPTESSIYHFSYDILTNLKARLDLPTLGSPRRTMLNSKFLSISCNKLSPSLDSWICWSKAVGKWLSILYTYSICFFSKDCTPPNVPVFLAKAAVANEVSWVFFWLYWPCSNYIDWYERLWTDISLFPSSA